MLFIFASFFFEGAGGAGAPADDFIKKGEVKGISSSKTYSKIKAEEKEGESRNKERYKENKAGVMIN